MTYTHTQTRAIYGKSRCSLANGKVAQTKLRVFYWHGLVFANASKTTALAQHADDNDYAKQQHNNQRETGKNSNLIGQAGPRSI